jgi:hypothetical protein
MRRWNGAETRELPALRLIAGLRAGMAAIAEAAHGPWPQTGLHRGERGGWPAAVTGHLLVS